MDDTPRPATAIVAPTATPIAEALLVALAERRFDRLEALFEPDVVLHALLPDGSFEWRGATKAAAAFGRWFGTVDECSLIGASVGAHGPRLQLRWRARVRGGRFGAAPFVVEQHVYADPGPTGRIGTMALLCSGFVREHPQGSADLLPAEPGGEGGGLGS